MAYWLRAGCAWRLLPHDLPPWQTVYHYFRSWRQQGLWEQVHATLRVQERVRQGATTHPRARRSWTAKEPEADSKIDGEWQAAAPGGASAEPGRIGEVRVWGWSQAGIGYAAGVAGRGVRVTVLPVSCWSWRIRLRSWRCRLLRDL
jgi:hypothetical protein